MIEDKGRGADAGRGGRAGTERPFLARVLEEGTWEGWGGRGWLRAQLKRALLFDASRAIDYYALETPPEGAFDLSVFPNVAVPFRVPIFFEGRYELPVRGPGGALRPALGLLAFVPRRIPVSDPGVVEASFGHAEDWVMVAAFMEVPPGDIFGPNVVWSVPIGAGGAPVTAGGEIPLLTAFRKRPPAMSEVERREAGNLASASIAGTDFLHAALFCLSCVNAVVERGTQDARGFDGPAGRIENVEIEPFSRGLRLERARRAVGLLRGGAIRRRLSVEPLLERLDRIGKAREIGLGHALTVCRGEFSAGSGAEG